MTDDFICDACGARVGEADTRCPDCGEFFLEESAPAAAAVEDPGEVVRIANCESGLVAARYQERLEAAGLESHLLTRPAGRGWMVTGGFDLYVHADRAESAVALLESYEPEPAPEAAPPLLVAPADGDGTRLVAIPPLDAAPAAARYCPRCRQPVGIGDSLCGSCGGWL